MDSDEIRNSIEFVKRSIEGFKKEKEKYEELIRLHNTKIIEFQNELMRLEKMLQTETQTPTPIQKNPQLKLSNYEHLTNNKIGVTCVGDICIHGCQCLDTKIACDGTHEISIYTTKWNGTQEQINMRDKKRFSVEELKELGYFDAVIQTVDCNWTTEITSRCQFAKKYPEKLRSFGGWWDGG